ncbi:MAG: YwbE family protein [Anaerolineaceae bacterium]|nr:YwbE family protein [Anaerolineaceae bacterium]
MQNQEKIIKRDEILKGIRVKIVLKQDQSSGKLTEGIVKDILTKSKAHPHGIKVRLECGKIGRVKELVK